MFLTILGKVNVFRSRAQNLFIASDLISEKKRTQQKTVSRIQDRKELRLFKSDLDAVLVERHREVIGSLAAKRNNAARGSFRLIDVENPLKRELLEI